MRAQTLRCWIWRADGVLAVLLVLVGVHVYLTTRKVIRPIPIAAPSSPVASEVSAGRIALDDVKRASAPWCRWGREPARAAKTAPTAAPCQPRELPLLAYRIGCWLHDPDGPDSVMLLSKDPAHPESYFPKEGIPDHGFGIERIVETEDGARITIRRGEEIATFDVRQAGAGAGRGRFRLLPPPGRMDAVAQRGGARPTDGTLSVKVVPFYGKDGRVVGGRVTGVRSGSLLARSGLKAGDVVVAVGESPATDVCALRALLASARRGQSVDVRDPRGAGTTRRLSLAQ